MYIKKDGPRCENYITKLDLSHLLSREQIEIVKKSTKPGDYISFLKDEQEVNGVVEKTYSHVFMLEDGRSFTWIDYITGSAQILSYLRRYHPIEKPEYDPTPNPYKVKAVGMA